MVSSSTYISDTVLFIRDFLDSNITDPIEKKRGKDRFVKTSYPQEKVQYPIITVRSAGGNDLKRMGMQSELMWTQIPIEVRIWARNEKERNELTEQVHNALRSNQFGGGDASVDDNDIHDFRVLSTVSIDETGVTGIKSSVMECQYMFVLGQS